MATNPNNYLAQVLVRVPKDTVCAADYVVDGPEIQII